MNPLADQLRPDTLDNFIGQSHLVGKDKPIRQLIESNTLHSLIFWGPPGCGKTTLVRIIAKRMDAQLYYLSAVSAGKKDLKTICEQTYSKGLIAQKEQLFSSSEKLRENNKILFLDEIHRFNKAQQDYLLPFVENGTITLIGATTENPSFEVNSALLSRCRIYVLQQLTTQELLEVVQRTLKQLNLTMDTNAQQFLADFANGDARTAINSMQLVNDLLLQFQPRTKPITLKQLKTILQSRSNRYDKNAESHYDTISAFIKSMRASNTDASLYYLARMVDAGEDPKFIARRMVIFASEDIGLAQPTALVVANAVFQAVETIGYPEAQINLAHGVSYLSQCPKNRSSYEAYFKALDDVKKHGNLEIPMNIRNAPNKLLKELGYGKGYQAYTNQSLLPEKIKNKKYFIDP